MLAAHTAFQHLIYCVLRSSEPAGDLVIELLSPLPSLNLSTGGSLLSGALLSVATCQAAVNATTHLPSSLTSQYQLIGILCRERRVTRFSPTDKAVCGAGSVRLPVTVNGNANVSGRQQLRALTGEVFVRSAVCHIQADTGPAEQLVTK